ncbi:MAG: hypothetical protein SangKO_036520 [Sandaracinaceae bacterium]
MSLPLGRPLRYADHPLVAEIPPTAGRVDTSTLSPQGPPVPLVDDLEALRSESFDPSEVHPRLRDFFEGPRSRVVLERVRWARWALPLGAVYAPLAERLGNLRVPLHLEEPRPMASAVRAYGDARSWTRCFSGDASLFYTGALRTWRRPDGASSYLSMTFPFPYVQLLVVLRLTSPSGGLVGRSAGDGVAGTYLIVPGARRFVALPGPPTEETLRFTVEGERLRCRHEDRLLGRLAFQLDYGLDEGDRRAATTLEVR